MSRFSCPGLADLAIDMAKVRGPHATLREAKAHVRTYHSGVTFGRSERIHVPVVHGWNVTGWRSQPACEIRVCGEPFGFLTKTDDGWRINEDRLRRDTACI